MADRKQCHAVMSKFEALCKQHNISVVLNRYSERWTADSLLESMALDDLYRAMDYYFQVNANPTWQNFARNADKLLAAHKETMRDKQERAQRREQLKRIIGESRG